MVNAQSKEFKPVHEPREETSNKQIANDSILLASFNANQSATAVNSRIEHDSDSSSSDSDSSHASSSSSSSSSSDSSKKSTRKYKKSKLKRSGKKSSKKKQEKEEALQKGYLTIKWSHEDRTWFHLKIPRPDANPRTRCDAFSTFKSAVEDVLAQHPDTAEMMRKHPILPNSIPSYVNKGLAAFPHAHMSISVKNLTTSVQWGDGLGLLKRLQTMNALATPADRNRAFQHATK
jgi:hypothetical protein